MAKADKLAERLARESELTRLTQGRPIEDELGGALGSVRARRENLLTELQGQAGVPSGGFARAFRERQVPVLERQAGAFTDRQRLLLERERFNLVFNNALELAVQSGLDVRQAEDYAIRVAEQDKEQQFLASEAEQEREFQRGQNRLADVYTQKGLDLEGEFEPQSDYEAALLRALTGTVAAVGTAKFLGRKPKTAGTAATKEQESVGNFSMPSAAFGGRTPSRSYRMNSPKPVTTVPFQFGGQRNV